MNYTHTESDGQLAFSENRYTFLSIPSRLEGFNNSDTSVHRAASGREVLCFNGKLDLADADRRCPKCGAVCTSTVTGILRSGIFALAEASVRSILTAAAHLQMRTFPYAVCSVQSRRPSDICGTVPVYQGSVGTCTYTLKQVAEITGLGKNTVKALDLKRLKELYTIDGTKLIRPEQPAKMLAIDEFKLHNGHRYATHIIDLDTGHILWISHGKKKQVVYDFIDHVGLEWMDSVEAVACDMNSDFQEAFEEKCPWIQPVFDYFHIVKNFNDKVVSEVRKDEQRRLYEEGLMEEARALKTRYILMSSRSTLQAKDAQARTGEPISGPVPSFPRKSTSGKRVMKQDMTNFSVRTSFCSRLI